MENKISHLESMKVEYDNSFIFWINKRRVTFTVLLNELKSAILLPDHQDKIWKCIQEFSWDICILWYGKKTFLFQDLKTFRIWENSITTCIFYFLFIQRSIHMQYRQWMLLDEHKQ